ncbi:MAG TPA: hypothetical protein VNW50_00845, partial [Streptosporangiaceae bacterium]|nr:hypothetical protein [Streptosporangiaceae bacterium]
PADAESRSPWRAQQRAVAAEPLMPGTLLPGTVLSDVGLWLARLELTRIEPGGDLRHLLRNLRSDRTWAWLRR